MYVGMARISVAISQSHSLKEKRMVIRRIKDRVRDATRLTISEVGAQDSWQRAELGCAVAASERQHALEQIDAAVRVVMGCEGGEVLGVAKDAWKFDAEPALVADKPVADDWVPDAWREEVDP
jgi:uncharacterized protein